MTMMFLSYSIREKGGGGGGGGGPVRRGDLERGGGGLFGRSIDQWLIARQETYVTITRNA